MALVGSTILPFKLGALLISFTDSAADAPSLLSVEYDLPMYRCSLFDKNGFALDGNVVADVDGEIMGSGDAGGQTKADAMDCERRIVAANIPAIVTCISC